MAIVVDNPVMPIAVGTRLVERGEGWTCCNPWPAKTREGSWGGAGRAMCRVAWRVGRRSRAATGKAWGSLGGKQGPGSAAAGLSAQRRLLISLLFRGLHMPHASLRNGMAPSSPLLLPKDDQMPAKAICGEGRGARPCRSSGARPTLSLRCSSPTPRHHLAGVTSRRVSVTGGRYVR